MAPETPSLGPERPSLDERVALGIVGAGPVGLAAAVEARRRGIAARVWDRGPLAAAVAAYPTNMVFFTSNELLEIGDHPLVTGGPKASRREGLDYYRKVAERERLDVLPYTEVTRLAPCGAEIAVATRSAGVEGETRCAGVVVATGYYHRPRRLGIPGEDLPHVSHYYAEAHPHWHRDVVVVGGGNSACEAALELVRAGARVTMVVRGPELKSTVKYWVRPDAENRIREGSIAALFSTRPVAITPGAVRVEGPGGERELPADTVLLLTGYRAEAELVERAGARLNRDGSVVLDSDSFESTVRRLYVIGAAGSGERVGEVFIENGRLHAAAAVAHFARHYSQEMTGGDASPPPET